MGACFSKKNGAVPSNDSRNVAPVHSFKPNNQLQIEDKLPHQQQKADDDLKEQPFQEEDTLVKKEIFVIKHRKSHDRDKRSPPQPQPQPDALPPTDAVGSPTTTAISPAADLGNTNNVVVRTSSCTKEEVDAILIQCGRLSRSNSSGAGKPLSSGRKYSGSKRSYDFDHNDQDPDVATPADSDAQRQGIHDNENDDRRQHRHRHRQSSRPSPSPSAQGRRRTPSRERDQNQRSGSRERGSSGSGRRVSRSPGRRSETTQTTTITATTNANANANRPGKMVSVPATVSSLVMDKSNNGVAELQSTTGVKRISVKRNAVEASRTAASPRSQSPARTNAKNSNDNNQQQPSLSRNSSRKAEQSPHRRNPLAEIDPNCLPHSQPTPNKSTCVNRVQTRNKDIEGQVVVKESVNIVQNQAASQKPNAGSNCKGSSIGPLDYKIAREQQQEAEGESLKPQALTRSRSARRSRDLDLITDGLINPPQSYTTLLLEDIQNFHQKNAPSFTLPPCVTKACSILEAVADLNSTTSSNLSCAFSEDRRGSPAAKKPSEGKDPFVESEVLVKDDLVEPSFHKYVTVRRGDASCGEDMDGQESSGSNSFVGVTGSQQHWGAFSSSSREPNSADSTDRWTSRTNTREDERSPLGFQRSDVEEARRGFTAQRTGIGRGRLVTPKNPHSTPVTAST